MAGIRLYAREHHGGAGGGTAGRVRGATMAIVDQRKGRIMKIDEPGTQLTSSIRESDQRLHRLQYTEIIQRARDARLAGATVLRSIKEDFLPRSDHLIGDGPVVRVTADIILNRGHQPRGRGERS